MKVVDCCERISMSATESICSNVYGCEVSLDKKGGPLSQLVYFNSAAGTEQVPCSVRLCSVLTKCH